MVLNRYRDFRWLFTGNSVSLLGSSVTTVALPLTAVVSLHASPEQMGLLSAVALLPHLILALPAGVWVDRVSYRMVLILADLAQMLLLGSVPVLAALGVLRIWQLYTLAALVGACNLFETVAVHSFTPRLVPRGQLMSANSTLMLSRAALGTVGTAAGSALVWLLTAPVAIAADAVSFLLAALCKAQIRAPGFAVAVQSQRVPLRSGVLAGLRIVFGHRVIRAVTLAATIGALAGQMQAAILVYYLVRNVGLSAALVGVVVAVGGAAGIPGALQAVRITKRFGPGPTFIIGMILASVGGLVLATASGPLALALVILVAAQALRGAGQSLYGVNQQTLRQALIPSAALSRATATWRFLVFGMQPIGAILGGVIASAVGLRAALVIGSAVMLFGTVLACASPLRTLRELPAAADDTSDRAAA